jgi:hypothetical protein
MNGLVGALPIFDCSPAKSFPVKSGAPTMTLDKSVAPTMALKPAMWALLNWAGTGSPKGGKEEDRDEGAKSDGGRPWRSRLEAKAGGKGKGAGPGGGALGEGESLTRLRRRAAAEAAAAAMGSWRRGEAVVRSGMNAVRETSV